MGLSPLTQVAGYSAACATLSAQFVRQEMSMMYNMMTGGMMWGMGLLVLLVLAFLVLGIAAFIKFLFLDQ
jgi:hypothetical protein